MKKALFLLMLPVAVALVTPAFADERYVSDQLVITLRDVAAEGGEILRTLRTGTPLQVLQEEGRYLRVRTSDGVEGYVLKQYVSAETPKPLVISRQEKEIATLRNRLQDLQAEKAESDRLLAEARRGRAVGESESAGLQQELAAAQDAYRELQEKSAGVQQLADERDELQRRRDQLAAEVESLREENELLLFRAAFKWFFAGAGVLLLGWFLGRKTRQKRRGYSF